MNNMNPTRSAFRSRAPSARRGRLLVVAALVAVTLWLCYSVWSRGGGAGVGPTVANGHGGGALSASVHLSSLPACQPCLAALGPRLPVEFSNVLHEQQMQTLRQQLADARKTIDEKDVQLTWLISTKAAAAAAATAAGGQVSVVPVDPAPVSVDVAGDAESARAKLEVEVRQLRVQLEAANRRLEDRGRDGDPAGGVTRVADGATTATAAAVDGTANTLRRGGAGDAAPSPDGVTRTRTRCHRMAGWGDVCVYDNVCSDGATWYFLEDDGAASVAEARLFYGHRDLIVGVWLSRSVLLRCACSCPLGARVQCGVYAGSARGRGSARCRLWRCVVGVRECVSSRSPSRPCTSPTPTPHCAHCRHRATALTASCDVDAGTLLNQTRLRDAAQARDPVDGGRVLPLQRWHRSGRAHCGSRLPCVAPRSPMSSQCRCVAALAVESMCTLVCPNGVSAFGAALHLSCLGGAHGCSCPPAK